jgi:hypothetical protein
MNWFQQNRWLGTFLVVFGICALIAGILFFLAGSNWSSARSAFDTATAERSRLEGLDPFPNDVNYRKMQDHLKNYSVALDKFKEELKIQAAPAPPLAPNEFQSRLRQVTVTTINRAHANSVKLPDNFHLGFDEFATSLPKTEMASLLGQELSQIQMLINILVEARVDSLTSLHRTPLPEERGIAPAPTPAPAPVPAGRKGAPQASLKLLERNVVDLSFKAVPSAARRVLNQIASSPGQFYIIRNLSVRNEKDKGPPREKTAERTAAAAQSTVTNPSSNATLNFIVGNEHIEVSAKIEMLRFTF